MIEMRLMLKSMRGLAIAIDSSSYCHYSLVLLREVFVFVFVFLFLFFTQRVRDNIYSTNDWDRLRFEKHNHPHDFHLQSSFDVIFSEMFCLEDFEMMRFRCVLKSRISKSE